LVIFLGAAFTAALFLTTGLTGFFAATGLAAFFTGFAALFDLTADFTTLPDLAGFTVVLALATGAFAAFFAGAFFAGAFTGFLAIVVTNKKQDWFQSLLNGTRK
jgi:prepilin signal peptidase PulO-like enzyme (type II secretory pathway)